MIADFFYEMLLGVMMGYLITTILESFFHKHILHASSRTLRFWRRHKWLFALFLRAYYSHHVVHHAWTFRQDFVTQFRDDIERAVIDDRITKDYLEYIHESDYGNTLRGTGLIRYVLPLTLPLPIVFFAFGPWVLVGTFIPIFVVYPLMARWIHPLLHLPHNLAECRTSWLGAWLLKSRYIKAVQLNHYLHHRYVDCNFNLVLGGDYILGCHRSPSADDLEEMRRIGIPR